MWILDKNHSVSFRKAASSTLAVLVVPLFIVMVLFNWYTIYQQQVTVRENRLSTLGVYQARWEDTLTMLDDYLADTVANANLPAFAIFCLVVLFYIFCGCVMDIPSTIIITMPIVFPLLTSLGYNPYVITVLLAMMCDVAGMTPPSA